MITVAFPLVQTQDRTVNMLQTNAKNAVQDLSNQVSQVTLIGEIKYTTLNLDQVQRQLGPSWVSANGANCVGSTYNKISGFLTVPNIPIASGISAYIRIN